jgi:triphosphatase
MEIELKYHLPKPEDVDRILNDPRIYNATDEDSEEIVNMRASYFDTPDKQLFRRGIAFRVRSESNKVVATLKWNGMSEDGMHMREEINIPVPEEKLKNPDIEIFRMTSMYDTLKKIVENRKLILVLEMVFDRRQVRLDTGNMICELSFDTGNIYYGGHMGPISEFELELYSGDRKDLEELGTYIANKFGFEAENRSKFKQGIDLAG